MLVRDDVHPTVGYRYCRTPEAKRALARTWNVEMKSLYDMVSRGRDDLGELEYDRHVGETWSPEDNAFLRDSYARMPVELLAHLLGRGEGETIAQLRALGLRNVTRYYEATRVSRLLGLRLEELLALAPRHLDIYPVCDTDGRPRVVLVCAERLAELATHSFDRLVERGGDGAFLSDLVEGIAAAHQDPRLYEPDHWRSVASTDLCPTTARFGCFIDAGSNRNDLRPWDLIPQAQAEARPRRDHSLQSAPPALSSLELARVARAGADEAAGLTVSLG